MDAALPNDDHGDRRNITQQRLDEAAQAAGIAATQAADIIKKGAA